ncbi:hypothetical protein AMTRI_Chr08g208120 [Amborella trichopoda]
MVHYYTLYHDLGFYSYFLCIFRKIVLPWHCLLCNASDQKNLFLENRKFISFSFICLSNSDENAFLLSFISLPWIYSELCVSLLFLFPCGKRYSLSLFW